MAELQILKVDGTTGVLDLQVLKVSGTITPLSTANLQILKISGDIAGLPVANAGPDLDIDGCVPTTLDGTGSQFATTWNWDVIGGPTMIINDGDTATPTVLSPSHPDGITVTVRLTVDGGSTDTMNIHTGPHQFWRLNDALQWVPFRRVTM